MRTSQTSALPGKPESACRKGIAPGQYAGACPGRQTASHFGGTCSSAGFTLIELLAVLALLAVVATAFITGSSRGLEAARFRALMTETVAAIGESRALAIRNARQEVFVVDLKQRRMGRDGGKGVAIPADVDIKATVAAANENENGAATLTFYPTGSSTGGTLRFRQGGQAYEIRVNWLTGHAALTRV